MIFGPCSQLYRAVLVACLALAGSLASASVGQLSLLLALQAPVTHGLTAEYFDQSGETLHVATRVDAEVNVSLNLRGSGLSSGPPSNPNPDMPEDDFSAKWSGYLTIPTTGTYDFRFSRDSAHGSANASSVYFNGTAGVTYTYLRALDGGAYSHYDEGSMEPVQLAAGTRLRIIAQGDFWGDPRMALKWKVPGSTSFVAIPQSALEPAVVPVVAATPTLEPAPNKVTVSWPAVAGATGYNVYRRKPSGAVDYEAPVNGSAPVTPGGPLSLADSSPAAATTHGYTVKPVFANPVTSVGTLASPSPMGTLVEGPFIPNAIGDTDRDGIPDFVLDQAGKSTWTTSRGAIFLANHDRDGNRARTGSNFQLINLPDAVAFTDSGKPVDEDKMIDGGNDDRDLAYLVVKEISPKNVTRSRRVFLRVDNIAQARAIHVFPNSFSGTSSIFGGLTETATRVEITDWVSDYFGVYLFIEGLFLRGQKIPLPDGSEQIFDGRVKFTIEVEASTNASPVVSDAVEMRVAPFLTLPNSQPTQSIWAAQFIPSTGGAYADNNAFRSGLSALGALQTYVSYDSNSEVNNQWAQDHLEIGYTQMPGGEKTWTTFRLPYSRGLGSLPNWPVNGLLNSSTGQFSIGISLGADSGDYGGNVETLFPTATHPLGQVLLGDTSSDQLLQFFTRQEAQPVVEVPTSWLRVGHVDEIVGVTGLNNKIAVADPTLAYTLMRDLLPDDQKRAVFFAKEPSGSSTQKRPEIRTVASTITGWTIQTGRDDRTAADGTATKWRYVRFISGSAAGVVARINNKLVSGLSFDRAWYTGETLLPDADPYRGDFWSFRSTAPVLNVNSGVLADQWRFIYNHGSQYRKPAAGDEFVMVENCQFFGQPDNSTPMLFTVKELLADQNMEHLNTTLAKAEIDKAVASINTAAGEGAVEWVHVPDLFLGRAYLDQAGFSSDGTAFAYNPGLANLQPGSGGIAFARQYGPRNASNVDIFEADVTSKFPTARFVDDWYLYHINMGEVHCGSNVRRSPYSFNWWTK